MKLASDRDIHKYTRLGVWSPKNLIDLFKDHVRKSPDHVCIVDPSDREALTGIEPERLTYAEFDRAVEAISNGLAEVGIGEDDIVVVQLPNTWELAGLYLAIALKGGIICPVPMLWRKAELSQIVQITGAKMMITVRAFKNYLHAGLGASLAAAFPSLQSIILLDDIRRMSRGPVSQTSERLAVSADDIFTICWTSGTEAVPKGCPLSHNNWKGMALLQGESAGLRPGDNMMTAGPLVNMASVGTVFIPWVVLGGTLVLHHPFSPEIFLEQMVRERVNYTLLVPAVTNMIAKNPRVDSFDLSAVRSITVGSAPSSLWTMREFKRRWGIDIGNIWGQNEGTGVVTGVTDVPDMERRVDHFPQFGKPGGKWRSRAAKSIRMKIIDPEKGIELTRPGEVGELVYQGPGVMAEYFRNPEATRKSFTRDGFFRTGDLFEVREDHLISFFDRRKDIVIRGGYNISAQEIENYLFSHPRIKDAAVVSMPDDRLGEKACAFIVTDAGAIPTMAELKGFLEQQGVAKYKWPERIERIDLIPRNPVGKIKKNILRDIVRRALQ
jgi:acyl-CoA synthetase (AMP-forming)/AMP-acid ligase II